MSLRFPASAAMGYGVLVNSLGPWILIASGGAAAPLLTTGVLRLATSVGMLLLLGLLYPSIIFNRKAQRIILGRLRDPALLPVLLGSMSYAVFAESTNYIPLPIAGALYDLWPVFFVLILHVQDRRNIQGRSYRNDAAPLLFNLGIAFAGATLVLASHTDLEQIAGELHDRRIPDLALGSAMATTAALLGGGFAFSMSWGRQVAWSLHTANLEDQAKMPSLRALSTLGSSISLLVAGALVGLASIAAGLIANEPILPPGLLATGIYSAVFYATSGWAIRHALMNTDNLGISAQLYGTTALSLGWLWLISNYSQATWSRLPGVSQKNTAPWLSYLANADVAHWPWLLAGVAAIIAANVMLNRRRTPETPLK